jgi:DNA (cytosine-5)-methyltransferase 1
VTRSHTTRVNATIESYSIDRSGGRLVRHVRHRDGRQTQSSVRLVGGDVGKSPLSDAYDHAWLRSPKKPREANGEEECRIVDLFSGCGAMSIGVFEACRALGLRTNVILGMDIDAGAGAVFQRAFPKADFDDRPLQSVIDRPLGAVPSESERKLQRKLGSVDVLVGGPPCQGHSDLNNHTRRADEKNALFDRMARFAQLARPSHVIVENVKVAEAPR